MENGSHNIIPFTRVKSEPGPSSWSFRYPHEVARDSHISIDEKRAILAAWASDRHAVESFPALRRLPGTPFPVMLSSIIEALMQLDRIGATMTTRRRHTAHGRSGLLFAKQLKSNILCLRPITCAASKEVDGVGADTA
jgi:hypothetical protein